MKIQKIKNIFPDQRIARYNLTAWQKHQSDSIYFIGREVFHPGEEGQPDSGILKLFELKLNGFVILIPILMLRIITSNFYFQKDKKTKDVFKDLYF